MPLRMMAAKGLVPLQPNDMVGALFMLTFDPDASVRDTAVKTAMGLQERVLGTALRDEKVAAPALGFMLDLHWSNDTSAELLILNDSTPDDSVARVARNCNVRTGELIANNQLRLLRHEDIVRQLSLNPQLPKSLIDLVCDFCVRSGLVLADVPAMSEARVRIYGAQAAEKPPDPGPTAEQVLSVFKEEVTSEDAPPLEEKRKMNLTQLISKMNIAEKIKLATRGNKEARGILIRDSNKLVCTATIRSPRITDGEVLLQAASKTAHEDVLRIIFSDRDWTKEYRIRMALVKNPKVPQAIAMRMMTTLRESDLKGLAKDKMVPQVVQQLAKKMTAPKEKPSGDGH